MRKPYFSIFGLSDRRRSSTFLFLALLIDAEALLFNRSDQRLRPVLRGSNQPEKDRLAGHADRH